MRAGPLSQTDGGRGQPSAAALGARADLHAGPSLARPLGGDRPQARPHVAEVCEFYNFESNCLSKIEFCINFINIIVIYINLLIITRNTHTTP